MGDFAPKPLFGVVLMGHRVTGLQARGYFFDLAKPFIN